MTKVVVGLSGGVDSAVAAYLLKKQGFKVSAIFMQNWQDDDNDQFCTIKQDSIDAIAVCDLLDIDIDIVNFALEYKQQVFSYFISEHENGRTPNPDILCNSQIKFKAFLDYAKDRGADYIATGHYVGKKNINGKEVLVKAHDLNKDQSYFLYKLNQHQIEHSLFPLDNLTKPEVRQIAASLHLPNAKKKDSTGICFIGERPFRQFLLKYLPQQPGYIVDANDNIVGEHVGLMYYTIGQRKGLGIGGQGDPWYVVDKIMTENKLMVVQNRAHPLLYKNYLTADSLSFSNGLPKPGRYMAKTRYRMTDAVCTLEHINNDTMRLAFAQGQFAITPGQSVVIYDGNLCLGGGIITNCSVKSNT